MIWAKEETLPRNEIEAIQLKKLKETVHYIYEKVAPYRKKMDEAGVKPEDIRTLEDLTKLPFTYKADFRDFLQWTKKILYDSTQVPGQQESRPL